MPIGCHEARLFGVLRSAKHDFTVYGYLAENEVQTGSMLK